MTDKFEGPILAVDIGGTKTLLAVFEHRDGEPIEEIQFPTDKSYPDFLRDFKTHLGKLKDTHFVATGVGMPGILDRETGTGISFGNLGWKNVPIKADLETILGYPVFVENDAKVGALSEACYIKDDFKTVMFIPLGTGIGIGLITDGIIDTKYGDRGGKAVKVTFEGKQVEWESIVSGRAIKERFGKQATDITDESTWKIIAHDLALGLVQLVQEKHPDAFVIGGGAGSHFERYGELLKQELSVQLGDTIPAILPAKHPDQAVIYGCVELTKQNNGQFVAKTRL